MAADAAADTEAVPARKIAPDDDDTGADVEVRSAAGSFWSELGWMGLAAPVLFGPHGVQNGGASLSFAWELMLENLAYTCTYGRKNCLTDKIYGSGPLTLGKIVGPVAGKLSEGVVRC